MFLEWSKINPYVTGIYYGGPEGTWCILTRYSDILSRHSGLLSRHGDLVKSLYTTYYLAIST